MNPVQAGLWAKLESFDPDEPDSSFTFSQRLARENNWTQAHARRVIGEYRRFLFLAVTAGHPVSPSDAVDQAWHLHLTYTRSYWEKLCGETLGRPFHHQPTRGGPEERAKFQEWYARTRQSYRTAFGVPAPADLWPETGRARDDGEPRPVFRRIDLRRYWMIPRPRWRRWKWPGAVAASGVMMIAGGQGLPPLATSLFDLRGPEFLKFYLTLFPLTLAAASALRWWWRQPGAASGRPAPAKVDPYVAAHLAGGAQRTTLAAVTRLAATGAVQVGRSAAGTTIARADALPGGSHPVEQCVYGEIPRKGGLRFDRLVRATEPACQPLEDELVAQGWVIPPELRARARWLPLLLAATPVMLGLIKIFVGLSRDRPVGFLALLCLFSTGVVLAVFARRPWRSRRGQAWLEREQRAQTAWQTRAPAADDPQLPLAIGLFGLGLLAHTPLAGIGEALASASTSTSTGGEISVESGGGSSDGGSDGGGSGCGGCGGGGGD